MYHTPCVFIGHCIVHLLKLTLTNRKCFSYHLKHLYFFQTNSTILVLRNRKKDAVITNANTSCGIKFHNFLGDDYVILVQCPFQVHTANLDEDCKASSHLSVEMYDGLLSLQSCVISCGLFWLQMTWQFIFSVEDEKFNYHVFWKWTTTRSYVLTSISLTGDFCSENFDGSISTKCVKIVGISKILSQKYDSWKTNNGNYYFESM